MVNRYTLGPLFAALILSGCKDKTGGEEVQATLQGTESEATTGTPEVPVQFDATPIAKLSETPSSIFQAQTNSTQILGWAIHGEEIILRAESSAAAENNAADPSYDLQIFTALVGAEDTEDTRLYQCKGLRALASGKAELVLRGDMLHVLCVNAPLRKDPGSTDAGRFAFDLGRRILLPKGSYGGDGSLDLDTIDLDEGE